MGQGTPVRTDHVTGLMPSEELRTQPYPQLPGGLLMWAGEPSGEQFQEMQEDPRRCSIFRKLIVLKKLPPGLWEMLMRGRKGT